MVAETKKDRTHLVALEGGRDMLRYLDPSGAFVRDDAPPIPDEDLVRLFRALLLIRVLEDRMVKLQRQGRIGFYIGTRGEEATHLGACYALRDSDLIYPAYREIGPALWRGYPLQTFIDQLFGNADDNILGRQMPNHHSAVAHHLASISSPVGTQIPQCAGSAWAAKIRGIDQVTMCFFGDGTTAEGDFHVGLNFAAVNKVPAIFFLRNNGWAISEPSRIQTATETFHVKGLAYGMRSVRIDGNDFFAVVKAVRDAAARARAGEGPTFIEGVTYRLGPHSTSDDPTKYRDAKEVDEHEANDPLLRMRALLQRKGLVTEETEQGWTDDYAAEVLECVKRAEVKPKPSLSSMFDDVFATQPWHVRRQLGEALAMQQRG